MRQAIDFNDLYLRPATVNSWLRDREKTGYEGSGKSFELYSTYKAAINGINQEVAKHLSRRDEPGLPILSFEHFLQLPDIHARSLANRAQIADLLVSSTYSDYVTLQREFDESFYKKPSQFALTTGENWSFTYAENGEIIYQTRYFAMLKSADAENAINNRIAWLNSAVLLIDMIDEYTKLLETPADRFISGGKVEKMEMKEILDLADELEGRVASINERFQIIHHHRHAGLGENQMAILRDRMKGLTAEQLERQNQYIGGALEKGRSMSNILDDLKRVGLKGRSSTDADRPKNGVVRE